MFKPLHDFFAGMHINKHDIAPNKLLFRVQSLGFRGEGRR